MAHNPPTVVATLADRKSERRYRDLLTVALEVHGRIVMYLTVSLRPTRYRAYRLCAHWDKAKAEARRVAVALVESDACRTLAWKRNVLQPAAIGVLRRD
jgi:hypothetical protein